VVSDGWQTVNSKTIRFKRIGVAGQCKSFKELAADVQEFFSRPLSHAVWEKTKEHCNPQFLRFVERVLSAKACLF